MCPPLYLCGKLMVFTPRRIFALHDDDDSSITISLPDERATIALGMSLAHLLQPGMVIYLSGNLGAGKTTLVRAILTELGYSGRVKSPTYTLVETYHVGELDLFHFDLYRLHSSREWESAGFQDEFDGKKIFVIEWPERAPGMTPHADLELSIDILEQGRRARIRALSSMGKECLKPLSTLLRY
jgi:tRNA threonylcarbamoyladenosine biosynthesis protein TsaE